MTEFIPKPLYRWSFDEPAVPDCDEEFLRDPRWSDAMRQEFNDWKRTRSVRDGSHDTNLSGVKDE